MASDLNEWGCRHTLAVLGFLGFFFIYALRVNLSFAIVAMVHPTLVNKTQSPDQNISQVCPLPAHLGLSDTREHTGEFGWDETSQGAILGAFYWGYTATNLLGGRAAEHFGGRLVFGLNIVLCAIASLLTPICARISSKLLIAVRFLAGAAQGGSYPSMAILFCTWIIPRDRSKFVGFVYSGSQVGIVITMAASGWLCSSDVMGGWPSVFYVFGVLGLLWSIPWFLLIRDRHESHPRITQKEIQYINQQKDSLKEDKVMSIPWKAIFTSSPFWAAAIGSIGYNFGFYALLNSLPTYLANILHFDIKSNGLLSATPYIGMFVVSCCWGTLMDFFTKRKILSIRSVRRLSTGLGCYGPMLGLLAMTFVQCNATLVISILVISVSILAANYCGYVVSYQDISPNLTGTLSGITNTLGAFTGVMAPGITGLITQNNQTVAAWRLVFLISAGVFLVCTTFYVIFVMDEIQPWNEPKEQGEGLKHKTIKNTNAIKEIEHISDC